LRRRSKSERTWSSSWERSQIRPFSTIPASPIHGFVVQAGS